MEYWTGGVLECWVSESSNLDSTPILHCSDTARPQFKHDQDPPPLHPLVSERLSIKIVEIMGAYKGRVNVKHRKRRAAKAERVKIVAAAKKEAKS
jgi:hypothetical protein